MEPCLNCLKPVENALAVHTYMVGEYPKREVAQVRYCKECRDKFEAEMRPANERGDKL